MYWWVNHKQTFKQETEGGYIWSPKRNKNGARNQTYENLTKARIGDIIFSYAHTYISAIGVVVAEHYPSSKPDFGQAGSNWEEHGWRVDVDWIRLPTSFKPKLHIDSFRELLPTTHSPLKPNGDGNQCCYLAHISDALGKLLWELAKLDANLPAMIDKHDPAGKRDYLGLDHTTTLALLKVRIGQASYRKALIEREQRCRVTGITNPEYLIASHIKPWRISPDEERLDPENGFLFAPHVDKLFDRGDISFDDNGALLAKNNVALNALMSWNIPITTNIGPLTENQRKYLAFHRSHFKFSDVYKKALNNAEIHYLETEPA
ncbi:HNH endonuclease [Shewanella submarina]|uniref:HNH endonuclease n=1 Tax=Shewanella submarina TaxID=2016376 RepID=A0ABV7GG34_9GAMM|nr:HNH endonuclease [Shewanella submarina]MCL1039845.1 HNH endonuclease [Shewanella submarina]